MTLSAARKTAVLKEDLKSSSTFLHSVKWAYTMNWGEQFFSAMFAFLLAALLGPREFGVVALAMVYVNFVRMLLEQGLVAALIQRRDLRPEQIDSVFWMVMTISLMLVSLSIGFSGWWAVLNHVAELSQVVRVLSVTVLLEALCIVQRALLQREMDFRSLSIRANLSVLIGGVIGIGLALAGFGIWALVVQYLVKDVVSLGLFWFLSAWRPRFRFSRTGLAEILRFSSANFLSTMGVFANSNWDSLALGVFFGPAAVGLYRLADRLMNMVLTAATGSLQIVSFSRFARLQEQPAELRKSVLLSLRLSSVITLPSMAFLASNSALVMAAIGPQWVGAGPVLRLLAGLGMVLGFAFFTGPLLQALGKPHFHAALTWSFSILGGALVFGTAFRLRTSPEQVQVMAVAAVRLLVGAAILTPIMVLVMARLCKIRLSSFFMTVAPSIFAACGIGITAMLLSLSGAWLNLKPLVALTCSASLSGLVGVSAVLALDPELRLRAIALVSKIRSDLASVTPAR